MSPGSIRRVQIFFCQRIKISHKNFEKIVVNLLSNIFSLYLSKLISNVSRFLLSLSMPQAG